MLAMLRQAPIFSETNLRGKMKKLVSIIASVALALSSACITLATPAHAVACYSGGTGTIASPWQIANATDLADLNETNCYSATTRNFKLVANIALTGNWTPILFNGTSTDPAVLDGDNFTISGLQVTTGRSGTYPNDYGAGFIAGGEYLQLKNLKLSGTTVNAGLGSIGAMAGFLKNSSIENVQVNFSGDLGNSNASAVGGLIGQSVNVWIRNSTFSGQRVLCSESCGGIAGDMWADSSRGASVIGAGVKADVSGSSRVGGIAGWLDAANYSARISNSFVIGNVTTSSSLARAGAFAGYVESANGSSTVITKSGISGSVRSDNSSSQQALAAIGTKYENETTSRTFETSENFFAATYSLGVGYAEPKITDADGNSTIVNYQTVDNLIEGSGPGFAVEGKLNYRTALNSLAYLPSSWKLYGTAVEDESHVKIPVAQDVSGGVRWVIDTSAQNPMNAGRPMPTALYNLGFFGPVAEPCAVGTYSSTGGTPCLPAPAGRYVSEARATTATQCQPGTYQGQSGQSSCIPASAGYFVASAGQDAQVPCPVGYRSDAQALQCSPVQNQGSVGSEQLKPSLINKKVSSEAGKRIVLVGSELSKLTSIKFGNDAVEFTKSDTEISFVIPSTAAVGDHDISLIWAEGKLVSPSIVTVVQTAVPESKPAALSATLKQSGRKLLVALKAPSATFLKLNGKVVTSIKDAGILKKTLILRKGKNTILIYVANKKVKTAVFVAK